jgi:hypothetical protein
MLNRVVFFAARIAAMEAANAPQPGPTPSASLLIQPAAPGLVARTFVDSCITSLDQVRALLASPANPSDETSLGVRLSSVKVGTFVNYLCSLSRTKNRNAFVKPTAHTTAI